MYSMMKPARLHRQNSSSNGEKQSISAVMTYALSGIFFVLSALLVMNSVKSVTVAYQRTQLLKQAESEVHALRLHNLELQQSLEYVSSESFVEEQARDRLLYTKGSEVLLVLPETGISGEKSVFGDQIVTEKADKEVADGWIRWWNVLCNGV